MFQYDIIIRKRCFKTDCRITNPGTYPKYAKRHVYNSFKYDLKYSDDDLKTCFNFGADF